MREVDEETREQFQGIGAHFQRLFDFLDRGFTAIDVRFERVHGDAAKLRDEMFTNFDALYKRNEEREIEYQAIKAALSRVEVSISQLETAARGDHDA